MNKVILIGNLTRDPENSTTKSGLAVCKMSLAVNRNFTNADGERECDFFNLVAWRQLAENCGKFLSKGKKIAVVGNLQTRSYETDEGYKKYVTEVMADEIEFLTPRDEAQQSAPAAPAKKRAAELKPVDDDDLPF
jgi:single-strand DNA-binding protein